MQHAEGPSDAPSSNGAPSDDAGDSANARRYDARAAITAEVRTSLEQLRSSFQAAAATPGTAAAHRAITQCFDEATKPPEPGTSEQFLKVLAAAALALDARHLIEEGRPGPHEELLLRELVTPRPIDQRLPSGPINDAIAQWFASRGQTFQQQSTSRSHAWSYRNIADEIADAGQQPGADPSLASFVAAVIGVRHSAVHARTIMREAADELSSLARGEGPQRLGADSVREILRSDEPDSAFRSISVDRYVRRAVPRALAEHFPNDQVEAADTVINAVAFLRTGDMTLGTARLVRRDLLGPLLRRDLDGALQAAARDVRLRPEWFTDLSIEAVFRLRPPQQVTHAPRQPSVYDEGIATLAAARAGQVWWDRRGNQLVQLGRSGKGYAVARRPLEHRLVQHGPDRFEFVAFGPPAIGVTGTGPFELATQLQSMEPLLAVTTNPPGATGEPAPSEWMEFDAVKHQRVMRALEDRGAFTDADRQTALTDPDLQREARETAEARQARLEADAAATRERRARGARRIARASIDPRPQEPVITGARLSPVELRDAASIDPHQLLRRLHSHIMLWPDSKGPRLVYVDNGGVLDGGPTLTAALGIGKSTARQPVVIWGPSRKIVDAPTPDAHGPTSTPDSANEPDQPAAPDLRTPELVRDAVATGAAIDLGGLDPEYLTSRSPHFVGNRGTALGGALPEPLLRYLVGRTLGTVLPKHPQRVDPPNSPSHRRARGGPRF